MGKRIGAAISVMRNHVRVEFEGVRQTIEPETEAPPCCTPAAAPDPDQQVEAVSRIDVHCGDRAEVLVAERRGLGARLAPFWLVTVLPVFGALVGGMLRGDAGTGIGIAAGFALGIIVALLVGRRMRERSRASAQVLRIIGSASSSGHCAACAGDPART